jgi:hypothetical protein
MYDIFGEDKKVEEEKIEEVTASPFEIIKLISEFKMLKDIVEHNRRYYGVYDNSKWQNLIEIVYNPEDVTKEGTIKSVRIKPESYYFTFKLLSYSPATWKFANHFNKAYNYDRFDLEQCLIAIEHYLPKKKLYIKNLGKKAKINKHVDDLSYYYKCSKREAEMYINDIISLLSKKDQREYYDSIDRGGKR